MAISDNRWACGARSRQSKGSGRAKMTMSLSMLPTLWIMYCHLGMQ